MVSKEALLRVFILAGVFILVGVFILAGVFILLFLAGVLSLVDSNLLVRSDNRRLLITGLVESPSPPCLLSVEVLDDIRDGVEEVAIEFIPPAIFDPPLGVLETLLTTSIVVSPIFNANDNDI